MSEGFAAVPNWLIRDHTVSLHAIVVYAALASHSGKGGIHPSQGKLAEEARCSDRQVRRALAELEALCVVERVRRKSSVGRATNEYLLHPNGPAEEVTDWESATAEVTDWESGGSGLSEQVVPLIEEEPIKKSVAELFDEFWAVYPRHVAKAAALAKFKTLAKTVDMAHVVAGASSYARDPNLPEKEFIPYPTTWLNQGRWEDEPLPKRSDREQAIAATPAVDVDEETRRRDEWLAARGITLEEYSDHWQEPGWLDELERTFQARRRSAVA